MDWNAGSLVFGSSTVYLKRTNNDFGSVNTGKRDHPLSTQKKTLRASREELDFVRFWHSDLITDSGQTAVPFWDAQTVAPVPAVPLAGVGFIWKTIDNSGGFVAPIVVSYDNDNIIDELNQIKMDAMIFNFTRSIESKI